MKKILAIVATVLVAFSAQAQNSDYNRISIGYDQMHLSESYDGYGGSMDLPGFDANYAHGFNLTSKLPLYLEVGGRLTFNTKKDSSYDYELVGGNVRVNMLALSIPVSLTYKFTFGDGFYVAPFAGINAHFNLVCQEKGTTHVGSHEETVTENMLSGDNSWNVCQFGGQVGVNLGYKAFNLGFGFYPSTPIYSKGDHKIRNNDWAITVGLNF